MSLQQGKNRSYNTTEDNSGYPMSYKRSLR